MVKINPWFITGFSDAEFNDIVNIIIPFFENYPILGIKVQIFQTLKKQLIQFKLKNILPQGFNRILKIKSQESKQKDKLI